MARATRNTTTKSRPEATDPVTPSLPSVEAKYTALFKQFLNIGDDIYSIQRMAAATAIVFSTFVDEFDGAARRESTAADMAEHLESWRNAVDFMVSHLDEMASALRKSYDAEAEVAS